MKLRLIVAVLVSVIAALTPEAFPASGQSGSTVGTLSLRAVFSMTSKDGPCPAGTDPNIECHKRDGKAVVPGLGSVSESYYFRSQGWPICPQENYRVVDLTVEFTVTGKGSLSLAVPGSECRTLFTWPTPKFTITGGSGLYSGASGSGLLTLEAHQTTNGAIGTDTWVGTLGVPGLTFDLSPPVVQGPAHLTVSAPKGSRRARVRYAVTAQDGVDGTVPVTCTPTSGKWFRIGHTTVECSALDKSGNTGTLSFTVTVRKAKKKL